uniref:SCAN box domain-containing protein n=1 Tax=Haplochromis burtoni TaxID=8153 RepID=A0A3Q2VND5_HAPBU
MEVAEECLEEGAVGRVPLILKPWEEQLHPETTDLDSIADLLQQCVRFQRDMSDRWEKESIKQDQKWRQMQIQMNNLQDELEQQQSARFRDPDIRPGESPKEFYNRLKDLYGKWIQPEKKTNEQVGDAIILEQFYHLLTPEHQVWVKERGPKSAQEAAQLVETSQAASGGHPDEGDTSHSQTGKVFPWTIELVPTLHSKLFREDGTLVRSHQYSLQRFEGGPVL